MTSHHLTRPRRSWDRGRQGAMTRTLTTLMTHAETHGGDDAASDDGDGPGLDLEGRSAEEAAIVIEGELVGAASSDLAVVSVATLLDTFLRDGRLVPAPTAELEPLYASEDPARAYQRARELDQMRARAWADSTLRNYGRAVEGWKSWCESEGVPVLPFDPLHVAGHLLDFTFVWDEEAEDYARTDEGELIPRVSAGTVALRLAGLNKAAELIGIAKPGENPGVTEVMRGIRRSLGIDPRLRKAALDYNALLACLRAAGGATFTNSRARAMILLRARCAATTGQMVNLTWSDVTLETAAVTICMPRTSRGGARQTVRIAKHRNPRLCLIDALTELKAISGASDSVDSVVFAHRDGRRLSRQAPFLAVGKVAATRGGWDGLPTLSDRGLASLIEIGTPRLALPTARDRALLLAGFYTASRRSNLTALNWRDVTDFREDGWRVVHRRGKTDQEGKTHTVWVPVSGGDACPAAALREWHSQLAAALGRQPLPDEPVFATLTSHGTLALTSRGRLARMDGGTVNDVVQRLCVEAGIASGTVGERNPYGAHSLRAGFVTEALRDDKLSIAEVQEVTNHKSVDVLMGYHRDVNGAKRNPSRKLISRLGGQRA